MNASVGSSGNLLAGRKITALYEIIPASEAGATGVLMKAKFASPTSAGNAREVVDVTVNDRGTRLQDAGRDFQFAAAVAAFGLMLDNTQHQTTMTWSQLRSLGESASAADHGELARLIELARGLVGDGAR